MKINVTKPSLPPYEEYCKEIESIWENNWLTNNGPKHKCLEDKIKQYLDVDNVTLFVNGHLALENAIELFGFPAGSEIITTPFTFSSSVNAIVRNQLVPVFCDINKFDYTIDVNRIEKLITSKTVAILGVHVYGNVCNIEEIEKIAKKHNLKVIFDSAHAFGVKYKSKGIGNFGDVSMFSFHATKVFNTIEGGCLCYKNSEYYQKLNSLKNFGIRDEDHNDYIGGNAKMNEFQAAMGICNLRYVDKLIKDRKKVYDFYLKRLRNIPGIVLPQKQENVENNYSYFPIVFDGYKYSRDEIKEKLSQCDIFSRKYFYPLINELDCYKNIKHGDTPVSKYISDRVLTLPLYPDLSLDVVETICEIILK